MAKIVKEMLKKALEQKTLKEVAELFSTTQKDIKQIAQEQGLKVKFHKRTNLTGGLIPCECSTANLSASRRLAKIKAMQPNWSEHEQGVTKKLLAEEEFKLGLLTAKLMKMESEIFDQVQRVQKLRHHKENLEKNSNDYLSFFEENQYGKVGQVEGITSNFALSKAMVLGWLSNNYNTNIVLAIKTMLDLSLED